jgi:hypothetical protein
MAVHLDGEDVKTSWMLNPELIWDVTIQLVVRHICGRIRLRHEWV